MSSLLPIMNVVWWAKGVEKFSGCMKDAKLSKKIATIASTLFRTSSYTLNPRNKQV